MGQAPFSTTYNTIGIGLPLIQGNADISDRQTIVRSYTKTITKRAYPGDLILTVRAPVGNIARATLDCCLGRGVCALRNAPPFLYYYFQYIEGLWGKISSGSTFDSINSETLGAMEIPLPPVLQQHRIVKVFRWIDAHITALSDLLAKQEAVKKSTLNLLMEPKGDWKRSKLTDFACHRNNTCSRDLTIHSGGNVHNLHYGDILVHFPEIVSLKTCQVDSLTNEGVSQAPADYLQDGDIVIADTAEDETVGKVVEIRDVGTLKAVAGLHTVFLRPPPDTFVRGWLGYWMNSRYYHNQLIPFMAGIKVLSLSKASLSETVVAYPETSTQTRIVALLSALDKALAASRAEIAKAHQLKSGLMHYFFDMA